MDSIDADYIWQRRIHHGVRYQKSEVPFPASVEIGLEFNAALERKEKLDLCHLTNAVMLELCDFAKTVTKSEAYFLFEMVEFNFDLGLDPDNDMQCYDYARRTHNKIKLLKEQIRMKPRRWKETFVLPDPGIIMGSPGSEQAGRYFPKRNRIVDSSLLTDCSKNSQSTENQKTESNGATFTVKKPGGVRIQLSAEAYPLCKDLGVTLVIRPDDTPKEKLDPSLVTNGVMMELLHFSRLLCGTHAGIVHDLVKQNFGHEMDKALFRWQISKMLETKNACLTAEARDAFRKDVFRVQTKKYEKKPRKRKDPDDYQELETLTIASKRRGALRDSDVKDMFLDSDLSYMCPVDFETELESGWEAVPEKIKLESCFTDTNLSLDVKPELEEVFVSPVHPQTNLFNICPKNATLKSVSDLFFENKNENVNVKTQKQKLWMRRAPRSKQILKSSRVNDMFARCREIGLDFNVGSGNKQNLDLQLFTNCLLLEVYRFATAMTKSLRSFLFDILNNNFNLVLQDELHERNFIFYTITKERMLQNHPDRWKTEFLNSLFNFPEVYNMVDVTTDFQTGQEVETEQQTKLDSQDSATSQQADMELHPFCKKLGLNLWSTERCLASQQLDLTVLTTGAVLEVFSVVRELCGSVRETVNDILEHNFDLDLQSGATEASQVIQKWYATQKSLMKRQTSSPKVNGWLNQAVLPNYQLLLDPQPPTANSPEDLDSEDVKPEMESFNGDVEMEEKKVNSYHICEEIGLVLNVGSQAEAKPKLDLRVLTRGVLLEMHQYVEQNCNRYVPALYEILEYNFDLSSQNHRKVELAWSIASQVIAIAAKNGRKGDYLNKVFELPVEVSEFSQIACKEEPDDGFSELDLSYNNDIMFVRELKPVDIEVTIE